MSPGVTAEKLHSFVAGCAPAGRIGRGGGLRKEGGGIEVLELLFVQVRKMADAKAALPLQHARLGSV